MPRPANILHDEPTATQTPIGSSSPPSPIPCDAAGSPGKNSAYLRYDGATLQIVDAQAAARAAGEYAAPHATTVYNLVRGRVADLTTGCVDVTVKELARQARCSRQTIWRTNAFLVTKAGVLTVSMLHDPRTGYRCGLRYVVQGTAYVPAVKQQDLPFKSRSTKSSAQRAPTPPRPPTPATMGFVQVAAWEVTNSPDVPDNLPDVSQAIRDWLAEKGATASERDIRAAMDHVEAQRRRQAKLPLLGVISRQARQNAPRTTNAGLATRSYNESCARYWAQQDAAAAERAARCG
jgi:hypothetical protein